MKLDLEKINIRRLITNRKYLFIFIALVFLSFLIIILAILPQIGSIFDLQNDITKEGKNLSQLQIKLNSLEDAQTLQLVENAVMVDKSLPSYKPLLELMEVINFVARQSGVGIADIQLAPGVLTQEESESPTQQKTVQKQVSQDLGGYKSLMVSLTVVGNMPEINVFLSQLEKVAPLVNINKIVLSEKKSSTQDGSDSFLEAELEIMTYYFTQSIKAAVNSPLPQVGATQMQLIEEIKNYYVVNTNQNINIQGGGSENLFGFDREYQLEEVN